MKRLVAVVALVGVAGCAREDWRALAPPEGVNAEVAVGTMTTVRAGHTATLLQDGTVLAVGGFGSWYLDTSETFDPATGNWTPRGNLVVSRQYHTATLLGSGKVLIVGGYGDGGATLATELYDPTTGLFRQTAGRLVVGRAYHTATLLRDGRVLVVGGNSGSSAPAEVEIFDPADESWSAGPALGSPRQHHTATLLADGRVLVAGGDDVATSTCSAEIFDPIGGTWTPTAGGMVTPQVSRRVALLLPDGEVLVAGGAVGGNRAEIYDPVGGIWRDAGNLPLGRTQPTATLLPNGQVLLVGGASASLVTTLYDHGTGVWSAGAPLGAWRADHTATLLPDGRVLIAGGASQAGAELYDPAVAWVDYTAGELAAARIDFTATLLLDGRVLVAGGGVGEWSMTASSETYDAGTGTWAGTAEPMTSARFGHTATLLPDGKVLVVGGSSEGAELGLTSAELFEPTTGQWTETGAPGAARARHTATLLPNGRVLVTGGRQGANPVATAELYDPATGSWTATGSLWTARYQHTATLLPGGAVLVAGGATRTGYAYAAELYDPATGEWTETGELTDGRKSHTATLLPSGAVLLAGGENGGALALSSAELYDASGVFLPAASLWYARSRHSATLLPSGRVLVAGGANPGEDTEWTAELFDPAIGAWVDTDGMMEARQQHAAALLGDGTVLIASGARPMTATYHFTAEIFDEGRGALAEWAPVIQVAPASAVQGRPVVLSGLRFTGISEGSAGGGSSASNAPLVRLQAVDSGASAWGRVSAFDATSVTFAATVGQPAGPATVTVVSNGILSAAVRLDLRLPPLSVAPGAPSVPPRGVLQLIASGGEGAPYAWELSENLSGATVDPVTGEYVAGAEGAVTDRVTVTDGHGRSVTTEIAVTAAVSITPAAASVPAGGARKLSATGGSGKGWTWSMVTVDPVGRISSTDGTYVAGTVVGAVDVVQVTDDLGNTATSEMTIVEAIDATGTRSAYGCSSAGGPAGPLLLFGLAARALTRSRRRAGSVLLALAVALPLAAMAAPREAKSRVAVMPIKAGLGVDAGLAALVTDSLVAELTDRGLQTITSKDVESALGFERQKQMLGCGDESCLAEIAGALGADRVVSGDIAQVRELTVFSVQVFNTKNATVEKRFHERMSGGDAADLLDATERAGAELFPGTTKSGTASRRRSVLTSTARPLALVARGGYDVKEPGGFGVMMLEYRLSRALRVAAGPLGTAAQSFGAALRAGWYPLAFERLSLYGAAEAHLLFPGDTLVGVNVALGAEWAFSERFAMSLEVPLALMASAPAEYRTTYFMPGASASWRF